MDKSDQKGLLNQIKFWFNYNIIFWRLIPIKKTRLGAYDIDREEYVEYMIQHKVTFKTLSYYGWGDKLTQHAIYQLNGQYKAFERAAENNFKEKYKK